MRAVFHEHGVPQHHASAIHASVSELAQRFANASEGEIMQHVGKVTDILRQRWGSDYAAKIDAIDALVAGVPGELGDALANAPWLLADPIVMSMLDDIAQRRARQ